MDTKSNLYGMTYGGGEFLHGTVFKLTHKPNGQWAFRVLHSFSADWNDGAYPRGGPTLDANGNLYGAGTEGGLYNWGTIFEMTPGQDGWTFKVIYNFCSQSECTDGVVPWAGLTLDKDGNLYGTAFNVFELSPGPAGWIESVLYNFCSQPNCTDGSPPYQGVILDPQGNIYGVTRGGGKYGTGVVYKLRHMPDGTWKQRVLHNFGNPANPADGKIPGSAMLLAMDGSGSLYGTTGDGGKNACGPKRCGVIFRLTRLPDGHWKEAILHSFKLGRGGYWPNGGVVIDATGNLYGSTVGGGDPNCSCGVVYKLAPNPDGTWTYTVLHRFTGDDGFEPDSNLTLDDKGNLYGTTLYGGPYGGGVVFKIRP